MVGQKSNQLNKDEKKEYRGDFQVSAVFFVCYIIGMKAILIILFLIALLYGGAAIILRMTYRKLL